jgi:hypothetical protein
MDVFVIPLGRDRYELYCEQPVELDHGAAGPPRGVLGGMFGRVMRRMAVWVRDTDQRHQHGAPPESRGWVGRQKDKALAWVAERISDQRLLWNLRGAVSATAAHPHDMPFDQVMTLIRADLQRDYDRHRRWLKIDGAALLVTGVFLGPLFLLIPGIANLPALYFAFRTFGHWLSMRGAHRGLNDVHWTSRPCPPLGELRDLALLDQATRDERVQDIAGRLHLQHLSTFFARMAARPA